MGFGIWGLGFGVQGLGFRVQGSSGEGRAQSCFERVPSPNMRCTSREKNSEDTLWYCIKSQHPCRFSFVSALGVGTVAGPRKLNSEPYISSPRPSTLNPDHEMPKSTHQSLNVFECFERPAEPLAQHPLVPCVRGYGFGFRVSGSGFRVSGVGFQVSGVECRA